MLSPRQEVYIFRDPITTSGRNALLSWAKERGLQVMDIHDTRFITHDDHISVRCEECKKTYSDLEDMPVVSLAPYSTRYGCCEEPNGDCNFVLHAEEGYTCFNGVTMREYSNAYLVTKNAGHHGIDLTNVPFVDDPDFEVPDVQQWKDVYSYILLKMPYALCRYSTLTTEERRDIVNEVLATQISSYDRMERPTRESEKVSIADDQEVYLFPITEDKEGYLRVRLWARQRGLDVRSVIDHRLPEIKHEERIIRNCLLVTKNLPRNSKLRTHNCTSLPDTIPDAQRWSEVKEHIQLKMKK